MSKENAYANHKTKPGHASLQDARTARVRAKRSKASFEITPCIKQLAAKQQARREENLSTNQSTYNLRYIYLLKAATTSFAPQSVSTSPAYTSWLMRIVRSYTLPYDF